MGTTRWLLPHAPAWVRGPGLRLPLVALGISGPSIVHSPEERRCLARHAAGLKTLVELGVNEGASTRLLRSVMSRDGTLYPVDPFPPGRFGVSFPRLIARVEVARVRNGTVQWLGMTDVEAAAAVSPLAPGGVDFVFGDFIATLQAHARGWQCWRHLIRPGGMFIQSTSQVVPPRTTPEHATVRFAREVLMTDEEFECIETVGTFTVLRRRRGR